MDREEVIRMARLANAEKPREDWNSLCFAMSEEALERFAALVAASERERCAKVCVSHGNGNPMYRETRDSAYYCAAAIRALP
jgi:DNA-nicking Smr family endonuclease